MNKSSFNGIVIDDEQRFNETMLFSDVRIRGAAEFIERVEAGQMNIDGYAMFRNFTTCDRLTVDGTAEFRQKLLTETVRNTGKMAVYGRLWADVLVNSGTMNLSAPSSLGRVLIKEGGRLETVSRMKVDRMTVNGTISVIGGIRGEEAEFISLFYSSVDSIYTEKLTVRRFGNMDVERVLSVTEADVLDADVEYTDIDQLCCDNALIGPGCHIRELMYRNSITLSSESFVERLIKV